LIIFKSVFSSIISLSRLCKKKKDIPNIISTRAMIQHDYRIETATPQFTKTHHQLMLDLLELSTSQYSVVRSSAQSKLFKMFATYAFAYRSIIDNIAELLSIDPNENHEAFKGALYLIGTNRKHRLITRPDWAIIEKLWIKLLKTKLSEKPSILKLMEAILNGLSNEFVTIATELQVSDEIVKIGHDLMMDKSKLPENYMNLGLENVKKSNDFNREKYLQIIKSIIEYSQSNNLHWRYRILANSMINVLLHPVTYYPCEVTEFSINNLINDSIQDRVISLHIVNSVFKQQKREHLKITINPFEMSGVKEVSNSEIYDGFRDDNKWLQYEKENIPKNQIEWDKPTM
jgi:proteasome activator subunit 4